MPAIILKYYNEQLRIGLADWQTAFLLEEEGRQPVRLKTETHRGQLVYRLPGSSRRISYRQVKKQLIKITIRVLIPETLVPF